MPPSLSIASLAIPLLLALVLDLAVGDPPNRYHPVAWMGSGIAAACRHAPKLGRWAPFAFGAGLMAAGVILTVAAGLAVERALTHLPLLLGWLLEAWLLKTTLAARGLARAAGQIRKALEASDLPLARRLTGWHLVSRDTSQLGEAHVAAAAVESVAENTSDGIIAPLLYYAIGGLPGALAYRFVNTADAMLGYRDPAREWLGKAPARLDDLANLLPSRLTAALIVLASLLLGENARQAWRVWRRDAGKTASPNAGHPMSAMAGALGLELEKIGHYRLGVGQSQPKAEHIGRAVRLMYATTALAVGVMAPLIIALWR
ncbi:MAG: adenosylcobinamide-phosphate synthase CbiB [Chloroflexota bacterium]|nr:adenosylcobinamide-phosphate synthase CbiB [Chloroflexota bacterium]